MPNPRHVPHAAVAVSAMVVALLVPVLASAQEGLSREIIEEKTRFTREEIQQARALRAQMSGSADYRTSMSSGNEVAVSDSAGPEFEVHAAINPKDSGNIIVAGINTASPADGMFCPLYYSKDFGVTWRRSAFRSIPKGLDVVNFGGGDPVVAFDEDGTAYMVWLSYYYRDDVPDTTFAGMYWAYSNDGGMTWQQSDMDQVELVQFKTGQADPGPSIVDKEWIAVDRTQTARRNFVYVAFLEIGGLWGAPRIVVRRKPPHAAPFEQVSVLVSEGITTRVQFSGIDVDFDGGVHVTFLGGRTSGEYALWHSVSTDGGMTFSAPNKISDVSFPNRSQGSSVYDVPGILVNRLYPAPQLAVDRSGGPHHGNLYVTWTADGVTKNNGNGLDIIFSRSLDNGQLWSEPVIINDDARGMFRHQHYSSITVAPSGAVILTWYDRRTDPANRIANYMMCRSFDGGLRFTKNMVVSTQPTDFGSVGLLNNHNGVGEYTQVVASSSYAIPVWTDGRNNNGDLNIYSAFVPIHDEGAAVERVSAVTDMLSMSIPVIRDERVELGFTIAAPQHVELVVFDAAGMRVQTLMDRLVDPGTYPVQIDTSPLPNGRYFCRLLTELGIVTRAFVVAR